jgi:hypothetical protein
MGECLFTILLYLYCTATMHLPDLMYPLHGAPRIILDWNWTGPDITRLSRHEQAIL